MESSESIGRRRTVLVVNDNPSQLRLMSALLEEEGMRVLACLSAEEALRTLREHGPVDVIVTDLYMPGIDGWRFCRLLRSPVYADLNNVPILVVSATFSGAEAEQLTTELGANAFLPAPYQPSALRACVRALLEGRVSRASTEVLIVEDNRMQAKLLQHAFQSHGYTVHVALTGEEARRLFQEHAPEIAILDYYLPDLTGDVLLEEFRRPASPMVMIVMTSDESPEIALRLMRKGADGYVRKPFNPEFLIELCQKAQRERSFMRVEELLDERTRQLRESEERYRTLIESQGQGIVIIDQEERFFFTNPVAEDLFGLPSGGLVGRSLKEFTDRENGDTIRAHTETHRAGNKSTYGIEITRPDGERRQLEATAMPLFDSEGRFSGTFALFHDVTKGKRTEQALRESEEQYRDLVENINDIIYATDENGVIAYVSPVVELVSGYSPAELTGQSFADFVHPNDLGKAAESFQQAMAGHPEPGEFRILAKSGEIIWLRQSSRPHFEHGQFVGVHGVLTDITERKQMEEELLKAQKLESISLLAGGIAHDFNNILLGVLGNISLAKLESKLSDRALERLVAAEKAALRAKDLTQQLLTFSRGGAPIKEAASIAGLIQETAEFALRGSNVRCELSIPEELWSVEVDTGQISQVIHNIILNADQSMPDGGVIRVRADNAVVEDDVVLGLKTGQYIQLSIEDQGIGIHPDHLSKIFDPYFTTKQRGSGLGLATAYSIIKKHDGAITVDSQLGLGTTFTLYLPASGKDVAHKDHEIEMLMIGRGKVLIMDDEELIRDVASQMLMCIGYEVVPAKDGAEAIDLYRTAQDAGAPFDVVIMDLTVPGAMGGKEAIRRLLEIDPQVKAIVSSGYSDDPVMAQFRQHGFLGFVVKPYEVEQLSQTLHRVMTEPGAPAPGFHSVAGGSFTLGEDLP